MASAPSRSLQLRVWQHCFIRRHKELLKQDPGRGKKPTHHWVGKTKQQIYWLKRNNAVLLVLSPGTAVYQVVRAAARQRRGTRDRGVGLAPLWTYALSSEINHSLYHSCSIWSHNHYPTAEKEMKPLIARGVGLSVQSRKVFIKFSFEKWFFMASFAGHATQKLDILSNCLQHIEPIYLEPL